MRQEAVVYRQTEAQVSDGGGPFYRFARAGAGPPVVVRHGKSSFFLFRHGRISRAEGCETASRPMSFCFFWSAGVNDCRFDLVSTKLCRKLLKASNLCCRRVDPNPITFRN